MLACTCVALYQLTLIFPFFLFVPRQNYFSRGPHAASITGKLSAMILLWFLKHCPSSSSIQHFLPRSGSFTTTTGYARTAGVQSGFCRAHTEPSEGGIACGGSRLAALLPPRWQAALSGGSKAASVWLVAYKPGAGRLSEFWDLPHKYARWNHQLWLLLLAIVRLQQGCCREPQSQGSCAAVHCHGCKSVTLSMLGTSTVISLDVCLVGRYCMYEMPPKSLQEALRRVILMLQVCCCLCYLSRAQFVGHSSRIPAACTFAVGREMQPPCSTASRVSPCCNPTVAQHARSRSASWDGRRDSVALAEVATWLSACLRGEGQRAAPQPPPPLAGEDAPSPLTQWAQRWVFIKHDCSSPRNRSSQPDSCHCTADDQHAEEALG